ncbi:MAG: respiratory nitrate reductase subunit gamma [Gemmatimonadota bacterium]
MSTGATNVLLFAVLPYLALFVCLVGTIYRYRRRGFTVSSLSSQFLEGRRLFWGSVPFHLGILALLAGHLLAFLVPDAVLAWNRVPVRLLLLEVSGFAFGLCVLYGLGALLLRRVTNPRIRAVTTPMDLVLEGVLLAQIVLGLWTAFGYRWGSSWFAADLTPYLWSLLRLSPDTAAVAAMPWVVQAHVAGAFVLVLLVPFTRLVHVLVAPLHYLVRPYQRVIWNWDPRTVRHPEAPWSRVRPS